MTIQTEYGKQPSAQTEKPTIPNPPSTPGPHVLLCNEGKVRWYPIRLTPLLEEESKWLPDPKGQAWVKVLIDYP